MAHCRACLLKILFAGQLWEGEAGGGGVRGRLPGRVRDAAPARARRRRAPVQVLPGRLAGAQRLTLDAFRGRHYSQLNASVLQCQCATCKQRLHREIGVPSLCGGQCRWVKLQYELGSLVHCYPAHTRTCPCAAQSKHVVAGAVGLLCLWYISQFPGTPMRRCAPELRSVNSLPRIPVRRCTPCGPTGAGSCWPAWSARARATVHEVTAPYPRAQVHFMWPNGRGELLAGLERGRPSYGRLVALLQGVPGSRAARTWVDRVNPFTRGLGAGPAYERAAGGAFYGEAADGADAGARGFARAGGPAVAAADTLAPGPRSAQEGSAGFEPGSGGAESGAGGAVSVADAQAAARAATDATRFGEVDIITGQPVRDLKMEPVMALRRWLRASGASGSFDDDVRPNSLQ